MIDAEELPSGWKVARLSGPTIAVLNPKKSEVKDAADETDVSFVPMSAVDDNSGTIARPDSRKFGAVRKGYTYFAEGDVIFAKITPCMENGKCAIARGLRNKIGFGSTEFHVVRAGAKTLPEWLHLILRSQQVRHDAENAMHGAAGQQRVPVDFLEQLEIPVPPLAEQRRLVARIEALTSRLEQARQARQAALAETEALSRSAAETDFQSLRKKSGVKPIGGVCTTITDGDHNTPKFSESGVSFVFVGNVSSGRLHFENARCVSPDYFQTLKPHRIPQRGDILYSSVGATLGIPVVVDTDEPFCFQRHIAILKPDRSQVDSQFVLHMLRSRTVTKQAWASITGSAQPTIPLNAIRKLEIPVPPLAEQRRIGVRLDALSAKQTELRRLQTETEAELAAVTPALLAKAFRGEL